jgi:hypothetical protein
VIHPDDPVAGDRVDGVAAEHRIDPNLAHAASALCCRGEYLTVFAARPVFQVVQAIEPRGGNVAERRLARLRVEGQSACRILLHLHGVRQSGFAR